MSSNNLFANLEITDDAETITSGVKNIKLNASVQPRQTITPRPFKKQTNRQSEDVPYTPRLKALQGTNVFDSLDVDTNQEIRYQEDNTASNSNIDNDIEETWSIISEFEKTRSAVDLKERTISQTTKKLENDLTFPPLDSFDFENFKIPELPRGSNLLMNIVSTWGDQSYLGLNGIEIFGEDGSPVAVRAIEAFPPDINILPEYKKDPRVVTNLLDKCNNTRDDTHMWLTPFTPGNNHLVSITFKSSVCLSMLRIWNYNKSRVHSYRGAKEVIILLDEKLIFAGEIQKAGGTHSSGHALYGDTILFTMKPEILEQMSTHDELFEPNWEVDDNDLETHERIKKQLAKELSLDENNQPKRPHTRAQRH